MAWFLYTVLVLLAPLLATAQDDHHPLLSRQKREMSMMQPEMSQVDNKDMENMGVSQTPSPITAEQGVVSPTPSKGKVQEKFNITVGAPKKTYRFRVGYFEMMVDGVSATRVLAINNQFPAPLIEADEGDLIKLVVVNNIQGMSHMGEFTNTSIHWHGLLQSGSPMHDGMNHITQCPIKSGSRRTYNFHLQQSGTYWYHSHLRSQYTEGLWGVFLIHPKVPKYQFDRRHVLAVSDWYHTSAEDNERFYLSPRSAGGPPYPYSILMNGAGRYNCSTAAKQGRLCDANHQFRPVFRLQRNKVNVFHLVNSGAWSAFNFTIDGHNLEVVEVEGTYLATPFLCEAIHISPGQRYAFIIHPKCASCPLPTEDFLIRAYLRRDFLFRPPNVANINPFPDAVYDQVTGVIRYTQHDYRDAAETKEGFTWLQEIPAPRRKVADMLFFDDLNAPSGTPPPEDVDVEIPLQLDFVNGADGVRRGAFNNQSFVLPIGAPLIHYMLRSQPYPQGIHNYNIELGQVVQVVINNPANGSHPIHLHGHNFHVMSDPQVGAGNFDPAVHQLTRRGITRDTIIVKERSHLVFRFVADNPGVWVMHCHIDWHQLSGMIIVFTEGAEKARKEFEFSKEDKRICADHGIIIRD